MRVHLGLDLQGGLQVTLQADAPPGQEITQDQMIAARDIVESRVNALGVAEPVIQLVSNARRIIVELPGVRDPQQAIETFQGTGLLEFVDAGDTRLNEGQTITTTLGGPETVGRSSASPAELPPLPPPTPTSAEPTEPTPGTTPTPTQTATPTAGATPPPEGRIFTTVITGAQLTDAQVGFDEFNRPQINFTLNADGARRFGDYTSANVGKYLAIVMDKQVLSSPVVQSPITEGRGRITGSFSLDEARRIVVQLKYGALPVPLRILETRSVGPTLGQDSVNKSLIAGLVGLGTVALFMLTFYRFPGFLAVIALLIYAASVFAAFKLIPVVLTLAGIAGFILSIGMAVDANILIFERMKEELRGGRPLGAAIDTGFNRAWTSIRDSNISTLITCAILYWFGANFRASIVQGFALTLAIGVLLSMFTAITVTRQILRVVEIVMSRNELLHRLLIRVW
ncbi:MAG: protein translocase subunit SecD [Chloroflexi bacterium]|nr:protein translocase subunit SecD [Chloroflexota bacterium]